MTEKEKRSLIRLLNLAEKDEVMNDKIQYVLKLDTNDNKKKEMLLKLL
jgi:hypothetical protein